MLIYLFFCYTAKYKDVIKLRDHKIKEPIPVVVAEPSVENEFAAQVEKYKKNAP